MLLIFKKIHYIYSMKKRNTYILVVSILTLFSFMSVGYMSCIKADKNPNSCDYLACQNGGSCYHAKCNCPAGYDSTFCNTMWVSKYPGFWTMTEKIVGSNYPARKNNKDSVFVIKIKAGGTPTSMIIDSMLNSRYYSDISCALTTATSWSFNTFFTPYNVPPFTIRGGYGILNNDSTMTGKYYRDLQTQNLGLVHDTVTFTMNKKMQKG